MWHKLGKKNFLFKSSIKISGIYHQESSHSHTGKNILLLLFPTSAELYAHFLLIEK
jgi:hypothetical protein